MQKAIIIGSGLGGLSTAVILAKNGYAVTVLEQQAQAGGCLQCFTRRGASFETGMHYVGSAAKGQTLDRLLRYLEVRDAIELKQLDPTGYDIIGLGGEQFRFATGREAFIDTLAQRFPQEREGLNRYYDLIERVANASTLHTLRHAERDDVVDTDSQLRAVDEVIASCIHDPLLQRVLVGNLPLYAGVRGQTPFATHAFIMDFYNQSAYRFVGGSGTVAQALIDTLGRYGGEVITHARAEEIVCDDTHATGVRTTDGRWFPADLVISDAHPAITVEMLHTPLIRRSFRNRIAAIPQSEGCFAVYLQFKKDALPYMNHNYFGYDYGTPWDCEQYDEQTWPKGFLYMHFCSEAHQRYADSGVIISYMNYADVALWADTTVGHRGADYESFKQRKAEKLLAALERHQPGTLQAIDHYYTSTPLTYRDYTGTPEGGMYGVAKDIHAGAAYRVSHRTKVPNVLQTGQNINSHGMLGVLVGTIVTCSELLTAPRIYQQIISSSSSISRFSRFSRSSSSSTNQK